MTTLYKTEGFVFKAEDRLEADRAFSVFTREFGKIEIFGKAIRKINSKLKGGIRVFSFSEITFVQGRNRKTLTDAVLQEKFKHIYEIPEKFETAAALSKTIDSLIKGEEKEEQIFTLLNESFRKLNNSTVNYQLFRIYFFWSLVVILGYGPELFLCASCRQKLTPVHLYFSSAEGGVICIECAQEKKQVKISSDIVKILRLMVKQEWDTVAKLKIEPATQRMLTEASAAYFMYLAERRPI